MISIITACYNSDKTIERAIKSLLCQSDNNFEHIIIDGDSRDNTMDTIYRYRDEYKKKNIKLLVISEPDKGLYDALNKGIRLSSGSFIGILNSDDWYEHDTVYTINKMISGLTKIDIIMGASRTINNNQTSIKYAGKSWYITSRDFNHGAMFVNKKCYEEIGRYEIDENFYNDFKWYIKAIINKREIVITNKILYNFVCGGMSTKNSLSDVIKRIRYRYDAYRCNNCSKLYIMESIIMEVGKYFLLK